MAFEILGFIFVGLLAGWFASKIIRGKGLGIIADLVLGAIGALIGGTILGYFGISYGGFLGSLTTAVIGAVVLLGIARLIRYK